jgi:hypothetical protein
LSFEDAALVAMVNLLVAVTVISSWLSHRSRYSLRRPRSVRSMAREAGVSKSTVQRIWSHNEIKPHRLETFEISNDPNFEERFWDVIGLYLDPPERAMVLCCDEKSQCQALERTQRPLPLRKG